nr:conserved hypothetical protein [Melanopsichium pennsylvanicum 4]
MRTADLTSASSTLDTYDRIGREHDFPPARASPPSHSARPSNISNMPAPSHRVHHFDADESLIPGVGRGVRSTVPSQTSYQERLRSLNRHDAQHRLSSPASTNSPYRPGKYSSAHISQARQPVSSSSLRPPSIQTRPTTAPRQPHVHSETESDPDSPSDSAESEAINVRTATFNSTGNHRNFAATPAGHTATITANFRQRPTLGQDTLDRIEFDIYTDTDGENRTQRAAPSTRPFADHHHRHHQQHARPRPDPSGPFASPGTTNAFGMNAADYQQHLASRTLTSPALRTLIGDRSKSPDSPTPTPSIDGVLLAGKTNAKVSRQAAQQQPRPAPTASVSAFQDLARRLQHDVDFTRSHRAEDADDGSLSNSVGSGFGPGSQASSARTRVEAEADPPAAKAFDTTRFNTHGYPSHHKVAAAQDATSPWGIRLPDVTGLTSVLGSPVKARSTDKHRPFDMAVGNQEARMEELVNLRCFVDGIQVELDRAGERILNLEHAQQQQSHEFQGLRSEMQSALKDVQANRQPLADEEHLVRLVMQQLQLWNKEQPQQRQSVSEDTRPAVPARQAERPKSQARPDSAPTRATKPPQQAESSQVEVVNRLYVELDKLRTVMEEQYRTAAALAQSPASEPAPAAPHHAPYQHRENYPSGGRDPWQAIEALRVQVLSLASEVEVLNGVVLDHLVTHPAGRKRQARRSSSRREERFYEDAHPASDPVHQHPIRHSSHQANPDERAEIRTDPIDLDLDHYSTHRRSVSFNRPRRRKVEHYSDDEEAYDRTIDAVAENLRVQRDRQQSRNATVETSDLDEAEISQLAETRAARAASRISPYVGHTHNSNICSVCSASLRSNQRKASRRARLLAAEKRREAVELEESILLDEFDQGSHRGMEEEQLATLRVMLQEHWDEFVHQRMLYSELADELKTMSPTVMSKPKRTILAQHVLEAVEMLEIKADRIERLENVIASCTTTERGGRGRDENRQRGREEEVASPMEKVRKEAGSRQASGTSTGSNRLKHALESFERRSRHSSASPRTAATGRNSPPTTLEL